MLEIYFPSKELMVRIEKEFHFFFLHTKDLGNGCIIAYTWSEDFKEFMQSRIDKLCPTLS